MTGQIYRFFGTYRFVLALMVLVSHASIWLGPDVQRMALGSVGVFSFFALSGFVIAEALDVFYRDSIRRFAFNRFLKIYPAFWAVVALTVLVQAIAGLPIRLDMSAILANLTIILSFFKFANNQLLISGGWAVIVELLFYATFGLAWFCVRRFPHPGRSLAVIALLFLSLYGLVSLRGDYSHSYSNLRYAPQFVFGAALYWAAVKKSWGAVVLTIMAGLLALHSYWIYVVAGQGANALLSWLLFAGSLTVFAILVFLPVSAVFIPGDRRRGDITYALYLVNGLVIGVVEQVKISNSGRFALAMIFGVALSVLIHFGAERPLAGWRARVRGQTL